MPYGLQDLLSYVPLTKPIQTVRSGIPRVLPEQLWTLTEKVSGDRAKMVEMAGTRKLARIAPYGSPPRQVEHLPISDRSIVFMHSIEELAFRDQLFRILRQWDDYKPMQNWAQDEIVRQAVEYKMRFENLRTAAVQGTLANAGVLWFDGNGDMLPNSSGAATIIDQLVPANNKNQLNGLIAASWALAGTDIVSQINALKVRAVQTTGRPLRYAFYGANITGYFNNNTSIQNYWWRNKQYSDSFLNTGLTPREMLELIWIPVQTGFYEDASGNVVSQFPADQVTFAPDITAETYALYEGSINVPTSFGTSGPDAIAVLKSGITEAFGMFRYAYMKINPVQILDVAGDTFIPRLKNPLEWYFADVTP